MTRSALPFLSPALVSLALVSLALVLAACGPSAVEEAEPEGPEPVADVRLAVVRRGPVAAAVEGFGTAVTEPGAARTYTVPFEGVVQSVEVAAGQSVGAGTVLVRLAPTLASRADVEGARLEVAAQEAATRTVEERYGLHLATRQERESQQALLAAARARLAALQGQTRGGAVVARAAGVVDTVFVQAGETVAPGTPLLSVAGAGGFTITLGLGAEALPSVRPGQPVTVEAVDRPGARAAGRVLRVEQALDVRTRLAQVVVSLPGRNPFLLGEYVRGLFDGPSESALVAPRDAVLQTEEGPVVFTVHGRRAFHHVVRIVAETDEQTGFAADGVRDGDTLVVGGLVGLSDSLRVRGVR